uniref:Uncharacterized protein n=1 Tax=Urocitellus parryii TaxID=9999 RepID=A0A8D2H453_UROPR
MYIRPGGKSLSEVPETRGGASRDTDLPVSDGPASPVCSKSSSFSDRIKELQIKVNNLFIAQPC